MAETKLAAIVAVFCLLGCNADGKSTLTDQDKNKFMQSANDLLVHPDAARFRWPDLTFPAHFKVDDFLEYCFQIDSKNSAGSYTGYEAAYAVFQKTRVGIANALVLGIDTSSDRIANLCRSKELEISQPAATRLTDDQVRAGCSLRGGRLSCARPGTGRCWEKGHNPLKGEAPSRAIDVIVDPSSPDYNHPERCG